MSKRKYSGPQVWTSKFANVPDTQVHIYGEPGCSVWVDVADIPELIARLQAFVPAPNTSQTTHDEFIERVASKVRARPEWQRGAIDRPAQVSPKRTVSRADSSVYVAKPKRPAKRKRKVVL